MTRKLLTQSAEMLDNAGFVQTASSRDALEDKGITHTVFAYEDRYGDSQLFCVRAKEYCYDERAPFGTDTLADARRRDALVVVYFDQESEFHVFDPEHVLRTGSHEMNHSKRSESRTWIEVDLSEGCLLFDYVNGHDEPTFAESTETTKRTSLFDYE